MARSMAPGYKSTEFWLTLLAVVISAVTQSGLIGDETVVTRVLTSILAVLSVLGYTASRSYLKTRILPLAGTLRRLAEPRFARAMNPGYKTTEFWLTLLAVILAAVLSSRLTGSGTLVAPVITSTFAVVSVLVYIAFRSYVKTRPLPPSPNQPQPTNSNLD